MPQFEVTPVVGPPAMVRAKDATDAVRRHAGFPGEPGRQPDEPAVALVEAEPGTGWQDVTVDGAPWGRVRPRDRMRFRRD